jgi:hypothetical protein
MKLCYLLTAVAAAIACAAATSQVSYPAGAQRGGQTGRGAPPARGPLEGDARLLQKVRLERRTVSFGTGLESLRRQSAVKLSAANRDIADGVIVAWLPGVALKDAMDAIGAVAPTEWEKQGRAYVLVERPEVYSVHLPKNEWQVRQFEAGLDFVSRAAQLPEEARDALAGLTPPGYGELPPAMQDCVSRLCEARLQEIESSGERTPFSLSDLPASRVSLRASQGGTLTYYTINIEVPGKGALGVAVNEKFS